MLTSFYSPSYFPLWSSLSFFELISWRAPKGRWFAFLQRTPILKSLFFGCVCVKQRVSRKCREFIWDEGQTLLFPKIIHWFIRVVLEPIFVEGSDVMVFRFSFFYAQILCFFQVYVLRPSFSP